MKVGAPVALRKESVDRNHFPGADLVWDSQSLSARRAWIEMIDNITQGVFNLVALRKESVDRNSKTALKRGGYALSLSARRAWIEICWGAAVIAFLSGRSPQGERG